MSSAFEEPLQWAIHAGIAAAITFVARSLLEDVARRFWGFGVFDFLFGLFFAMLLVSFFVTIFAVLEVEREATRAREQRAS